MLLEGRAGRAASPTAIWALGEQLGSARARQQVLLEGMARHLGIAALVGAEDCDTLALVREVTRQITALANPRAPILSKLAEALQVGDEAICKPVGRKGGDLDGRPALGAVFLDCQP